MRILLVGYGKMGHAIERMAQERGHTIVMRIDPYSEDACDDSVWQKDFPTTDVAIEFTTPATAQNNVNRLLDRRIPVVSGTTGWDISSMQTKSRESGVAFLWASNFSLGVNLFFAVNAYVKSLLQAYDYRPSITEIHHIHKLDRPSGTAKTLAEQLGGDVPIESIREGEVPGTHSVLWDSAQDSIELRHTAKSRDGFALGAVLAAEWLMDKSGPHTMQEVLRLSDLQIPVK